MANLIVRFYAPAMESLAATATVADIHALRVAFQMSLVILLMVFARGIATVTLALLARCAR